MAFGLAYFIGLAASAAFSLAYGFIWLHRPATLWRALIKTGAVAALAAAAAVSGAHPVLALALGLSAAGDFALGFPGRIAMALGILFFLLAQLLYLFAFFMLWIFAGDLAPLWPRYLAIAALWAFAIGWYAWLAPGLKAMAIPVAFYLLAITAMASMAMMQAWIAWPAMLGALSFVASDAVLAAEMFRMAENDPRRPLASHVVWWTYYAAQILIPAGIILAAGAGA